MSSSLQLYLFIELMSLSRFSSFELRLILITSWVAENLFWRPAIWFLAFENCFWSCLYDFARSCRVIFCGFVATKKSYDRDNMILLLTDTVIELLTLDVPTEILRSVSGDATRCAILWCAIDSLSVLTSIQVSLFANSVHADYLTRNTRPKVKLCMLFAA